MWDDVVVNPLLSFPSLSVVFIKAAVVFFDVWVCVFVYKQSKKAGNVHFWVLVAVCTLVACLTLTNDRVLKRSQVSSYLENELNIHGSSLDALDVLTDVSLFVILVTVVFGVLGAAAASSFIKKLDLPPLPINA